MDQGHHRANLTLTVDERLMQGMGRLTSILFVINTTKPGAEELAVELSEIAQQEGVQTRLMTKYPIDASAMEACDFCVVVGGDGTLLGVVDAASRAGVPVMGVNLGRLGFMASFSPEGMKGQFQTYLKGDYSSRELTILQCHSESGPPSIALNDIVIKARSSRLIRLEVHCEDEHMNTYHADGLIFSTPTGSTAYNLSAGGPIVHPSAKVMVTTPINPHTLSNRAIVLDDSHVLTVHLLGDPHDVQVSADGKEILGPVPPFPLKIRVDRQHTFRLVQPQGYSHYYVLRNKLRWSGDAVFTVPRS